MKENLIIVRGAGDLATGIILRLVRSGFKVLALEAHEPLAIRRTVSFCPCISYGYWEVEGTGAKLVSGLDEIKACFSEGMVPVAADPDGEWIRRLKPAAVVDAILAKENLGTTRDMAPVVIGVGPGFEAGKDVDAVIETKRGHDLGRAIYEGPAAPNTGIPGVIGGYSYERVIHSPASGIIRSCHDIGDHVEKGEKIAAIGDTPVTASITGILRGLIADGTNVTEGLKIADIDPRDAREYCFTVSDKANAVAGGVLEAVLHLKHAGKR